MLRPQDTSTRERKNLNGLWQFALDPEVTGQVRELVSRPLPAAREMAVPASFNDIAADAAVRDYFGDVWYQRTVWVPRGWQDRRIVLHFESATHRATVWVNDVEVVSHEGGYTPFEADITEHVAAGRGGADHRLRQQHPQLPVHPARRHRGHPRREAAALLARLLQLRGHPPHGLAVRHRPGPRHRRHCRHRPGRRRRAWSTTPPRPTAPAMWRPVSSSGTPTASRWPPTSEPAGASWCRTCTSGPRATATCTTSRSSWSATTRWSTATTRASACAPSRWTASGS